MQVAREFSCSYFNTIYDVNFIKEARITLKGIRYDTMVGIGLSGILAVAKLSSSLKKNALYLRKSRNTTHSNKCEEGHFGKKWIIVDDFMNSGKTIKRVYKHVKNITKRECLQEQFMGIYLYESERFIEAKNCDFLEIKGDSND